MRALWVRWCVVAPSAAAALTLAAPAAPAGTSTPPSDPRDDRKEARLEAQQILSDSRYHFCHSADYALTSGARRWCGIVAEREPRCPSFADACKVKLAATTQRGQGCAPTRSGPKEYGSGHSDDGHADDPPSKLELGPTLGRIIRTAFVLLLGVGIAYLVWAIVKNLRKPHTPDPTDADRTSAASAPEAASTVSTHVEKDVERLLARARAAAERGEFEPAIGDTYAALLRKLDGDGLIEVHPARTNGEYVRALRHRPDLMEPVRGIVRNVECVQFGAVQASRELFGAVYEHVLPIVGKATVLLLLFGLLPASACSDTRQATSFGPLGTEAIVDLLRRHGVSLDTSVVLPRQLAGPKTLLLIDTELDTREWKEVVTWAARDRGTIVAVGRSVPGVRWSGMRSVPGREDATHELGGASPPTFPSDFDVRAPPGRRLDVQEKGLALPLLQRNDEVYAAYQRLPLDLSATANSPSDGDDSDTEEDDDDEGDGDSDSRADAEQPNDPSVAQDTAPDHPASSPAPSGLIPSTGPSSQTTLSATEQRFRGALVAFADARLFQSVALSAGDNPAFLLTLFREMPSSVVLWDALSGRGSSTPVEAIDRAHLTPLVLQLFLFFGLLFLYKGVAFGRLREPAETSSRRFADHVRALGQAYARANASTHVVGLYSAWALDRLRERAKMTGRSGLVPIAEALSAQTGRSEAEVMRVLLEAHSAKEEAIPASAARASQVPSRPPAKSADDGSRGPDFSLMQKLDSFLSGSTADRKPFRAR